MFVSFTVHYSLFISLTRIFNEELSPISSAKKISLTDAEALLYNGCVFGGHICPLCMKAQDKISFYDYDFVDMEYVWGFDQNTGAPTIVIPFYAFYKKIGNSTNGNEIYAKTYVAAIEVKEYDDYIKEQESKHSNS